MKDEENMFVLLRFNFARTTREKLVRFRRVTIDNHVANQCNQTDTIGSTSSWFSSVGKIPDEQGFAEFPRFPIVLDSRTCQRLG